MNAGAHDLWEHVPDDLADQLARGPAKGRSFGRRVHYDETPLVVERIEGVRDARQDCAGPVMGLAQGRLGLFAPGDVRHGANQAGRAASPALALESGQSVCFDPDHRAVGPVHPVLGRIGLGIGWIEGGFHRGPDARQIVRVQEFQDLFVQSFAARDPEDFGVALVVGGDTRRRIVVPPSHVRGIQRELSLLGQAVRLGVGLWALGARSTLGRSSAGRPFSWLTTHEHT